jgi:ribonuclease D
MPPERYDLPIHPVDSPESLAEALPHWHRANLLSVDAEFSLTGMHHCVLALLQVATHDRVWLVDPLPIPELMKPALEAMASVPWIIHDFSGDGIVFKRLYDVVPDSVMDTMLLARALGYDQPGLKTMARLKLGVTIPKEEQDSNWMLRPLRDSQIAYAARDATLLLPLLRALSEEADARRREPGVAAALARLPAEMAALKARIRAYRLPSGFPMLEKIRRMGLGAEAEKKARRLLEFRYRWGNEGDVAAVMEMGARWILARLHRPPRTREELERVIPNPRFRRRRLEALWEVLGEPDPVRLVEEEAVPDPDFE